MKKEYYYISKRANEDRVAVVYCFENAAASSFGYPVYRFIGRGDRTETREQVVGRGGKQVSLTQAKRVIKRENHSFL